ncbi:uncharacterized protein [Patagioenas fasciata]|uniref:uncharacterized protein n=1 Tax=Patagioenas fasciata TaxID=372321 RepID=UPI0032E8F08F
MRERGLCGLKRVASAGKVGAERQMLRFPCRLIPCRPTFCFSLSTRLTFAGTGGPLASSLPVVVFDTKYHVEVTKMLLPGTEEGDPEHDCVEVIEYTHASRPYLKDTPLAETDWELFTDGSSFVENGMRYAGYAITTAKTVIEAKPLPPNTSAQKVELIVLTRALELSENKKVNIWTDSKYASCAWSPLERAGTALFTRNKH